MELHGLKPRLLTKWTNNAQRHLRHGPGGSIIGGQIGKQWHEMSKCK